MGAKNQEQSPAAEAAGVEWVRHDDPEGVAFTAKIRGVSVTLYDDGFVTIAGDAASPDDLIAIAQACKAQLAQRGEGEL